MSRMSKTSNYGYSGRDGVYIHVNSNALLRDLRTMANGLKVKDVTEVFVKALKPIEKQAKKNARTVRTGAKVKGTGLTKSGRLKSNLKHKGGRDLAKAIGTKRFGRRSKIAGANVSLFQSKLPTTSRSTGKAYKAFGKTNVPIAHFIPGGTKLRRSSKGNRGRIAEHRRPIWKAYKTWRAFSNNQIEKGIFRLIGNDARRTEIIHFKR